MTLQKRYGVNMAKPNLNEPAAMDDMKRRVRERYAATARTRVETGGGSCCSKSTQDIGYAGESIADLPECADMGLGCGNPLAFADLQPGETVLDLGSGGGIDCFIAANTVGPAGHVIGLDMTEEMIAVARANATRGGYDNVEFRLGEIETMPVESETVDMVISNCVINLVPDKKRAFAEAFRVLKPDGRLHVSDIVLDCEKLPDGLNSIETYVECISGAIPRDEYLELVGEVGFHDIAVNAERDAARLLGLDRCSDERLESSCCSGDSNMQLPEGAILSVTVSARKPF